MSEVCPVSQWVNFITTVERLSCDTTLATFYAALERAPTHDMKQYSQARFIINDVR